MRRRFLVYLTIAIFLMTVPSLAAAAVVHVPPGVGTLQAAIDSASPGDVLRLERSTYLDPSTYYVGAVSVTKKLKIRGKLGTRIDAGCTDAVGVEILADEVQLTDAAISGGVTHGLRVAGRSRVKLKNMGVFDHCSATGAGIELDAVQKLSLYNVRSQSFPIGTEVANLAADAAVKLAWCGGNGTIYGDMETGVLIRNVAAGALELVKCQAGYASYAGIVLEGADGVSVRGSLIIGLGTGSTSLGIEVEADSDENLFQHNFLRWNQTDVVDDGMGNCWRGNQNPIGTPLTGNPSTAGCP